MLDVRKLVIMVIVLLVAVIGGFTLFEGNNGFTDPVAMTPGNETPGSSVPMDKPRSSEKTTSREAPMFTLPNLIGDQVSLADFAGKIVFVNFWATWCGPCKAEITGFVQLQEKYRDDLVIIGISVDRRQTKDRVVPFAEDYAINYPVLYSDGKIEQQYGGISGIPTTFILDRQLNVVQQIVGYRSETVFEQVLKSLL